MRLNRKTGKAQGVSALAAAMLGLAAAVVCGPPQAAEAAPGHDLVIVNARIMTVTHGTIEQGSVWIHGGKIAGVGKKLDAPRGAKVIDAGGRYLTPGIIDAHSHIGMGGLYDPQDTNEIYGKPLGRFGGPVQSDLRIRDSIKTDDNGFYLLLSSGLTSGLELPGSGNLFGGQAVPIKMKFGRPREEMFIDDAPMSLKIACGTTPARVWKGRGVGIEKPEDVLTERRKVYAAARAYRQSWVDFEKRRAAGDTSAVAPARDLKLEPIAKLLDGTAYLQMHCHGAEAIAAEVALAKEFGITLRTVHHGTESYKVAKQLAAAGSMVLGVTDWWGGGVPVADGIPWNLLIDKKAGVRVAIHGEGFSIARRLTQEAGKMIRYSKGTLDRNDALAMVTLNAAYAFGLDNRLGSIDVGKDADIVIWDGDPLSSYGHAAQVFIDGELFFDSSLPGLGLAHQSEKAQ
ncbi:amidohydrolase family protein [Sphingopyxis sp. J-6]|uniref:amidohydrolase family protein n=1 Tax=Sphingopyxis sp. J-6 TaxID=3122054 RepID=UPI0039840A5F